MLRNFVSVLTAVSLLVTTAFTEVASAATKAEKEAKTTEKIKAKIKKQGIGEHSRVTVGLRDSKDPRNIKELKGYVSKIDEESFDVTNLKTNETTTVAYRDAAYVRGKGLPTAATVGIIVGAVVGAILLIMLAACGSGGCH
jgi:hypothetical protein